MIIVNLYKVWPKFTPIKKKKFTQSLHNFIFLVFWNASINRLKTPKLEMDIFRQPMLLWDKPKNTSNNRQWPTNCAGVWYIWLICYSMRTYQKFIEGIIFGTPENWQWASDFSKRGCVLYNAHGRATAPSLSLPGWSWPILRPWQDSPKHVQGSQLGCTIKPRK